MWPALLILLLCVVSEVRGDAPQVAAALSDPSNPIAQGAVGSANMITAAICKITNDQPAAVCNAAPVTALKSQL